MHDDLSDTGPRDPREAAAEYRLARLRREHPELAAELGGLGPDGLGPDGRGLDGRGPDGTGIDGPPAASAPARGTTERERAAYVETAIQQAIRRGDFDDLPGAGKPIPGLGDHHDPDWWIRRKIQSEQISGLGPPALRLRVENTELDAALDAMAREDDVRDTLADFNRRVIEARRQLLGGPPVVTPTRDVEAELAAWRERRAAAARAAAQAVERERADDIARGGRRRRPWRKPTA